MTGNDYFYGLMTISTILAMVNIWNYKKYKALVIKDRLNEAEKKILILKLKECEQHNN